MHGTRLTTGPIKKELWNLAWPIMLSVFFHTLYNTVDAFWVSKISPEAIAAVSISQITLFVMVAFSMGITVGSGVVMAMHIGAKEMLQARKVLGQSFVLSAIAGVVATIILFLFRDPLLMQAGAVGTIFPLAVEYFNIINAGAILLFVMFAIVFAFNAQGDTKTLTKLFAFSTGLNTLLDPLFIFGWLGFPELGIAGAAYATLLSQLGFIVVALYVLSRPSMMVPFHVKYLSFNWQSVKRVFAIGFPAALTQVLGPIGIATLTFIAGSHFHEAGSVATSIGFRVEFFAFLPAIGFGVGSMAMLGQNMGAGNVDRARDAYKTALKMGVGIAIAFGIIIVLLAGPIVGFFTDDPLVFEYAVWYLRIVPLSYGFLAAMMIEASSFQGIGKSWPGFWISLLRITLLAGLSLLLLQTASSVAVIWVASALAYVTCAIIGYVWLSRTMNHLTRKHAADDPAKH